MRLNVLLWLLVNTANILASPLTNNLVKRSPMDVTSSSSNKGPKLETFYSAKESFAHIKSIKSHSPPSSPTQSGKKMKDIEFGSSSPPKVDTQDAAKVAKKLSHLHVGMATHSMIKGITAPAVQVCAGAVGCAKERYNVYKITKDPKTKPDQIKSANEKLQDHKDHMIRAAKTEFKVGTQNAKLLLEKAKKERELGKDLQKQHKRESMVGSNTRKNENVQHLTRERYKQEKQESLQHIGQQWSQTGHIARLGATGKDSIYTLGSRR